MKKQVAALLVLLIVIIPVFSLATSHSDLKWGMTRDEVKSILGEPDESYNDIISNMVDAFLYLNQTISKFNDSLLTVLFRGNSFYCKTLDVSDDNSQKYDYLKNALIQKYGDGTYDLKGLVPYVSAIISKEIDESYVKKWVDAGSFKNIVSWILDDNSYIVLFYTPTDSGGITEICYSLPENEVPEESYNDDGL